MSADNLLGYGFWVVLGALAVGNWLLKRTLSPAKKAYWLPRLNKIGLVVFGLFMVVPPFFGGPLWFALFGVLLVSLFACFTISRKAVCRSCGHTSYSGNLFRSVKVCTKCGAGIASGVVAAPDQTRFSTRSSSYFTQLFVFSGIAIYIVLMASLRDGPIAEELEWWLPVAICFVALFMVYGCLETPRYVEIASSDVLEFHSLLGTKVALIADLREIASANGAYTVVFRFEKASFTMINRIDGLPQLLAFMKARKPDLIVKGF
jgi:hypothetical protein